MEAVRIILLCAATIPEEIAQETSKALSEGMPVEVELAEVPAADSAAFKRWLGVAAPTQQVRSTSLKAIPIPWARCLRRWKRFGNESTG